MSAMPSNDEVSRFFFKAMLNGWAAGVEKIKISEMPGYKAIPFEDGDFRLLDAYCVNPNNTKSAGVTTVWFQDIVVWTMYYGGEYEDVAIPVVKEAMIVAYSAHKFFGGRGEYGFTRNGLMYFNESSPNFFRQFSGREWVVGVNGERLGYHNYFGMSHL